MAEHDTRGKRLRAAREKRGWTQGKLAQRSGVNQPLISKVERDTIGETPTVIALAKALECNLDWLTTWEGPSGIDGLDAEDGRDASKVTPIERAASSPYSVVKSLAAMLSALGVDERKYAGAILEELVKNPDDAERIAKLGRWLGGSDDQQNEASEAIHRRTQP